MTVQVSVVVPTYKRSGMLSRCLAALAAQDLEPNAYEVVIADNAGSEDTRRVVESWAKQSAARIVYVSANHHPGPAAARNAGWRSATGHIIAFTDDDCIPEPGWLRSGVAAFTANVTAVAGQVIVPLGPSPTDYERNEAGLQNAEFVTANCLCRRDVLQKIGGFDERFTAAWREDSDLQFTLLKNGCTIARCPTAVVRHPVRPARWGVSVRQQRKNQYNALLYKKHPRLYLTRIQRWPPWSYYLMVVALLVAVASALWGWEWLTAAAVTVWLVLAGEFCWRRLRHTSCAPSHVIEMIGTSVLIPPLAIFWRLRGSFRFRVLFL